MKNQTMRLDQEDFFYQETAVPVIDDIMGFLKALKKPGKKSFQYVWDYPVVLMFGLTCGKTMDSHSTL